MLLGLTVARLLDIYRYTIFAPFPRRMELGKRGYCSYRVCLNLSKSLRGGLFGYTIVQATDMQAIMKAIVKTIMHVIR